MRFYFALIFMIASHAAAQQSSITEAEGYSCMGVDYSKKQTEQLALQDAKRQAMEFSKTYIESTTEMENFSLKRDLVESFAKAEVQVLEILKATWDDPGTGDCYQIKIQAEVIPSRAAYDRVAQTANFADDPSAPLAVKIWTNQTELAENQTLKIYLRSKKPFFGRIIYKDAAGTQLQLLPNPYRDDVYFQGGVSYEVPSGLDRYDLVVQPPFGRETVSVYASTSPLGDLETTNLGPVLEVQPQDVAKKTRGIKLTARPPGQASPSQLPEVSEFAESHVNLTTRKDP